MSFLQYSLAGPRGFAVREKAAAYAEKYITTTGAERGSTTEQSFGLLAEATIRHLLRLPTIEADPDRRTNLGYDILSPTGIKIDVKCRGGKRPFEETYAGSGYIRREAKHNFFARQVYDARLNTDIYVMTHLLYAGDGTLSGTPDQKDWKLYICGWVSKERVKREGVYLPKGSLTEQGRSWFSYRGHEIEFFQRNLNPLSDIAELLTITPAEVLADYTKAGFYNLTGIDAVRIALDLYNRNLLTAAQLEYVKQDAKITGEVPSAALHPNQYHHLAAWLHEKKILDDERLHHIQSKFPLVDFTGV